MSQFLEGNKHLVADKRDSGVEIPSQEKALVLLANLELHGLTHYVLSRIFSNISPAGSPSPLKSWLCLKAVCDNLDKILNISKTISFEDIGYLLVGSSDDFVCKVHILHTYVQYFRVYNAQGLDGDFFLRHHKLLAEFVSQHPISSSFSEQAVSLQEKVQNFANAMHVLFSLATFGAPKFNVEILKDYDTKTAKLNLYPTEEGKMSIEQVLEYLADDPQEVGMKVDPIEGSERLIDEILEDFVRDPEGIMLPRLDIGWLSGFDTGHVE